MSLEKCALLKTISLPNENALLRGREQAVRDFSHQLEPLLETERSILAIGRKSMKTDADRALVEANRGFLFRFLVPSIYLKN